MYFDFAASVPLDVCWKNGKDSSLVMMRWIKAQPSRCVFTASTPLGRATVFMDITLSFLCSSPSQFLTVSNSKPKNTVISRASWPSQTHCHLIWFFSTKTKRWIFKVVMFYGYSSCQCSGLDGWSVVLIGTYRRHKPFMPFMTKRRKRFFWHS